MLSRREFLTAAGNVPAAVCLSLDVQGQSKELSPDPLPTEQKQTYSCVACYAYMRVHRDLVWRHIAEWIRKTGFRRDYDELDNLLQLPESIHATLFKIDDSYLFAYSCFIYHVRFYAKSVGELYDYYNRHHYDEFNSGVFVEATIQAIQLPKPMTADQIDQLYPLS
jgi:hypothetical protein